MKDLIIGVLALVVLGGGAFFLTQNGDVRPGASSGPDHYEKQFFLAGSVDGGKYTSIATTSATYTLSPYEFDSAVVDIESSATGAALTLTLPATTTSAYPVKPGQGVRLLVKNSHTAAATTTTIAAGTGVDLQENDGQNVVIGITNYAFIECVRLDTTDVACSVNETIPAD